ncbi:MAG: YraN family protein [Candidatus Doudnabacteria bacterium]|nr:YraN family protein [Candidatus Doudnabacteria bacterium]
MFNFFKPKLIKPASLGQRGEEFAQELYRKKGYKIIAANFFNRKGLRKGEVDFIAANKTDIVFVEVKTRRVGDKKFGGGAEAVNLYKQLKLLKAVKIFLQQHAEYVELKPQIDVCLVDYNELDNPQFCAKILMNAVEDWN